MFEKIREIIGLVNAIAQAPTTGAKLDATLALMRHVAEWTPTEADDTTVDFLNSVLSTGPLRAILINLIDRYLFAQTTGTALTLDAHALTTGDQETVKAHGIDLGKLIELVKLLIEIWRQLK